MNETQDRLELDSRLDELGRVQPWVDELADRFRLPAETRFAMQLCLEEALANVVLHGYGNEPGHPIMIRSFVSAGFLYFAIQDQAPAFAPLMPDPPNEAPQPASLESIQPGGNGIRLIYHFAGSVEYERLSDGNLLTIGFPVPFA